MACCVLLAGAFAVFLGLQAKIFGKSSKSHSAVAWRLERNDRDK